MQLDADWDIEEEVLHLGGNYSERVDLVEDLFASNLGLEAVLGI